MSKLRPTVPAGSGVQKRARLNKEQAQPSARSPALPAPTGNAPAERLGRQPKGTLLPGRRQRASGSKLPHKDTRGRGGGTLLTNPPQLRRGCRGWRAGVGGWGGAGRAISALPNAWVAPELAKWRGLGCFRFRPPSPAIPGLSSHNNMMSMLSKSVRTLHAWLEGRLTLQI